MLWANRNGFFYVLDRATGEFLSGKPFVKVNVGERLRCEGAAEPGAESTRRHARSIPNNQGATNW